MDTPGDIAQIDSIRFIRGTVTSYQITQYDREIWGPVTTWPGRWFGQTGVAGKETHYSLIVVCHGMAHSLTTLKQGEMADWITAAEAALCESDPS